MAKIKYTEPRRVIRRADAQREFSAHELYDPNGEIQQKLSKPVTRYVDPFDTPTGTESDFEYYGSDGDQKQYSSSQNTFPAFSAIGDFFSGIGDDFVNSGRYLALKISTSKIDDVEASLYKNQLELQDLDKINEYQRLCVIYEMLEKDYKENPTEVCLLQMEQAKRQIKQLNDYFITEGRTHDVVAQHMFNTTAETNARTAIVATAAALSERSRGINTADHPWYRFDKTAPIALETAFGVGEDLYHAVADFIDKNIPGFTHTYDIYGNAPNDITKTFVKNADLKDKDERRILYKMYKGKIWDKDDSGKEVLLQDKTGLINSQLLSNWKNADEAYQNELKVELHDRQKRLKKGQFNWFGRDINFWDPSKLNPQFVADSEKHGEEWTDYLNPYADFIYGIPETGSTIALFEHLLTSMGVNAALGYLADNLTTWAIGGGKYKYVRGVEKVIGKALTKLVVKNSAKNTAENIMIRPTVLAAMQSAAIGSGLYGAYSSRLEETRMEMIQGITDRVLGDVVQNGGNIPVIENDIEEYAKRAGVDTSDMDLQEKIKLGVALGVESKDNVYNNAVRDSRDGINKLINANNALATMDYLETLPFLNYSGQILRNFGRSLGRVDKRIPAGFDRFAPQLQGTLDYAKTKSFIKAMKKGEFTKALTNAHIKEYLKNKGKILLAESMLEGLEEINQEVLQDRYKAGAYDDYQRGESMFDIPEVFDNARISADGVTAFLGLSNDSDLSEKDIRKSFMVGMLSSMLFSGALGAATNVTKGHGVNNIRGLIAQIRNDKVVGRLVGDMYGNVQDQAHLELFYDAFSKAGVNRERLLESLRALKEGNDNRQMSQYWDRVNELVEQRVNDGMSKSERQDVTQQAKQDATSSTSSDPLINNDYIDNDIKLMNAAWTMYTDGNINDHLKEIDAKKPGLFRKGNSFHKQFVIDGATAIVERGKTVELLDEIFSERKLQNDQIESLIDKMTSDDLSDEEVSRLRKENPKLAESVDKLNGLYTKFVEAETKARNHKRGIYFMNTGKAAKKGIEALKKDKNLKLAIRERYEKATPAGLTFDEFYNETLRGLAERSGAKSRLDLDRALFARAFDIGQIVEYRKSLLASGVSAQKRFDALVGNSAVIEALLEYGIPRNHIRDVLWQVVNGNKKIDILGRIPINNENGQFEHDLIEKAVKKYNFGMYSAKTYITNSLWTSVAFSRLNALNSIISVAKNRAERLLEIRKMTGLDTETRLDEIVLGLEEQRDELQKQLKKQLETSYGVFQSLGISFDNEQDIVKLEQQVALNKALLAPQITLANAYMFLEMDPNSLRKALYGNPDKIIDENALTEKDHDLIKSLDGITLNYNNVMRKLYEQDKSLDDGTYIPPLSKKEKKKIKKEAKKLGHEALAKMIIKRTNEHLHRLRIANREYQEEFNPIVRDVAPETEHPETEQQSSEKPSMSGEAQFSNDEKALRRKVDKTTKTEEERRKEKEKKAEKRKEKEGKLGINEGSAETPAENSKPLQVGPNTPQPGANNTAVGNGTGTNSSTGSGSGVGTNTSGTTSTESGVGTAASSGTNVGVGEETNSGLEGGVGTGNETNPDDLLESHVDDGETIDLNGEEIDLGNEPYEIPTGEEDPVYENTEEEYPVYENTEEEYPENYLDDDDLIGAGEINVVDDVDGIKDPTHLTYEDGSFQYDGVELSPEELTDLINDLVLGAMSYDSSDNAQMDEDRNSDPRNSITDSPRKLVSSTMFYNPDPDVEDNGEDVVPKLLIGDEPVKLEHPVGSGRELGQKLTQPGWLDGTKKYYIVTQATSRRNTKGRKNSKHDYLRNTEKDGLTVAMIIDDGKKSYVVFYKSLGKFTATTGVLINEEQMLRDSLRRFGIDDGKIVAYARNNEIDVTYTNGAVSQTTINAVIRHYAKTIALSKYAESGSNLDFEVWFSGEDRDGNQISLTKEQSDARKDELQKAGDTARKYFAAPGKTVLTTLEINEEVQKLRENRNAIIDAYVGQLLPGESYADALDRISNKNGNKPITTVTPQQVTLSNGKFNVARDKVGRSIFSPIIKLIKGLGVGNVIDNITSAIVDGNLLLGFGLGAFAVDTERFRIKNLINPNDYFEGRGLSGKIYLYIKTPNGTKVPVMLHEQKFATKYSKELGLIKNANTGEWVQNDPSVLPSACEVLLHMLLGEINFRITDRGKLDSVIEFFVHHGEKTLLQNQPKTSVSGGSIMYQFAKKQLHYDAETGTLSLWMKDDDGNERLISINKNEILANDDLRLRIINAMEANLHWNTDVDYMTSLVDLGLMGGFENSDFNTMMKWAINTFGQRRDLFDSDEEFLNQRIKFFGNDQMAFTLGDFYKVENGKPVAKPGVSIVAWMLKEGKLSTDLNTEQPFYAPFVFASGVSRANSTTTAAQNGHLNQESSSKEKLSTNSLKTKADKKTKNQSESPNTTQEKAPRKETEAASKLILNAVAKLASMSGVDLLAIQNDALTENANSVEHGGIKARVIFTNPNEDGSTKIPRKGKAFDSWKDKVVKAIRDAAQDESITVSFDLRFEVNMPLIKNLFSGRCVLVAEVYGDGKVDFTSYKGDDLNRGLSFINKDKKEVSATGVFSKDNGGHSTFNLQHARDWLSSVLGVNKDQVVVMNGLMKSIQNGGAYGMTTVVRSVITNEIFGQFVFQDTADAGIEYHEAWHYVNLLLHNKETRKYLYKAFGASKNLGEMTLLQIEELMADDFKKFVLRSEDKSVKGIIKRFYYDVLGLLFASGNKKAYYAAYKAILSGKYKGMQLEMREINEFVDKYGGYVFGANDVEVLGFRKKDLGELKHINNYHELLEASQSLIDYIFDNFDVSTPKAINKLIAGGIDAIKDSMGGFMMKLDLNSAEKIKDIINNDHVFKEVLVSGFKQLGLKVKLQKSKKSKDVAEINTAESQNKETIAVEKNDEQEPKDATEAEDKVGDTNWEKFSLERSKKDNASIRTKRFLMLIPMYDRVMDEEGNALYLPAYNDFNTQRYYDIDEAWRTILSQFWSCDSFGEMVNGKYSPTSLMGMVENIKATNPFYYGLYQKLKELEEDSSMDGIVLRNQLYSTINSEKTRIQLFTLENPIVHTYDNIDEFETDAVNFDLDDAVTTISVGVDRVKKRWVLRDSSLQESARSIPRRWSKNFASNGFLTTVDDKGTSKTVLDEDAVNAVVNNLKNIKNALKSCFEKGDKVKDKVKVGLEEKSIDEMLDEIEDSVISLYQSLGIECDKSSLDTYLQILSDDKNKNLDAKQRIKILKSVVTSGNQGSIASVINALKITARSKSETLLMSTRSKYAKEFDEVFNLFELTSHIGQLALAWATVHPLASEFSVMDANNNRLYPINENSFVSARLRQLMSKSKKKADDLLKYKYNLHSIVLRSAKVYMDNSSEENRLYSTSFVGVRDPENQMGADYFGITPLEDLVSKMLLAESDVLINPTMADKKRWGGIAGPFKLSHDLIINRYTSSDRNYIKCVYYCDYNNIDIDGFDEFMAKDYETRMNSVNAWMKYMKENHPEEYDNLLDEIDFVAERRSMNIYGNVYRRASDETLERFSGYFMDELDAIIDYYSKTNIAALIKNKNLRIINYHGKPFKDTDGKTRLDFSGNGGRFRYFYDIPLLKGGINLNQKLLALWNLQRAAMNGTLKDASSVKDDVITGVPISALLPNVNNTKDLDGFELIRSYLQNLKKAVVEETVTGEEYSSTLKDSINGYLMSLIDTQVSALSEKGSPMHLVNNKFGTLENEAIPQQLIDKYQEMADDLENKPSSYDRTSIAIYSAIANFTLNLMTSVLEFEKVFAGDPAFYKAKSKKETLDINITYKLSNGQTVDFNTKVDQQKDSFTDKIKRLGSLQSTGLEINLSYTKDQLDSDPTLACKYFTNVDVQDIKVQSAVLDAIKQEFKTQLIEDAVRSGDVAAINALKKFKEAIKKDNQDKLLDDETVFHLIHSYVEYSEKLYNMLPEETRNMLEEKLSAQIGPYKRITVADALVIIRPETYRKIRIGLGQWSDEIEDAYNIIEGYEYNEDGVRVKTRQPNTDWMYSEELYAAAKKLLAYALKFAYFDNDVETISGGRGSIKICKPRLGKLAGFPLFSYMRSSEVGKALYDRMNAEGNEIDMISFESAIKVGGAQAQPAIIDTTNGGDVNTLNETFGGSWVDGKFIPSHQNAQSIDYNSSNVVAHKDSKSNPTIATQIHKYEMLRWQLNTEAHANDTRAIGTLMFKIAFQNIEDNAWYGHGKRKKLGKQIKKDVIAYINALTEIGVQEIKEEFYDENGVPDLKKITNWIMSLAKNNGVGPTALNLLRRGAVAESLISRTVFENACVKEVNKKVVDINTTGGTAVQQSMFGFSGYSNVGTIEENQVFSYNGGRELEWNSENNSMQVMLSVNFFKSVIPKEVWKQGFVAQRQYLIEHDIICADHIGEAGWKYYKRDVKPYGLGYRIPTQGMSSIFVMLVGDVLPETSGDLIIVPREFTAQTGSDFDVDKLYIATLSYTNGEEEKLDFYGLNREGSYGYKKQLYSYIQNKDNAEKLGGLKKAFANRLLHTYINIISDEHNFAQSRASIDVITKTLLDEFVDPYLREGSSGYQRGGYELTPVFQMTQKMLFSVGKAGIAPFALNITNMTFTQTVGLTINSKKANSVFGLNPLNRIYGQDGNRISDWLSAMVNANVDVAKDPYVFLLNVNHATYNICNYLLRSGKGISTFGFLAQPILKDLASRINSGGGLYKDQMDGNVFKSIRKLQTIAIYNEYINKLEKAIKLELSDRKYDGVRAYFSDALLYYKNKFLPIDLRSKTDFKLSKLNFKYVFDFEFAKLILNAKKQIENKTASSNGSIIEYNETGVPMTCVYLLHLLNCLEAFCVLDNNAKQLSSLIQVSQIDTKKQGNTLALNTHYVNSMRNLEYTNETFTIVDNGEFAKIEEAIREYAKANKITNVKPIISRAALLYYFENLFLEDKTTKAEHFSKKLLSSLLFSATELYCNIFMYIMKDVYGEQSEYPVVTSYDNKVLRATLSSKAKETYKPGASKEQVTLVSQAIDNVLRYMALSIEGYEIYKESKKKHPKMIDFTFGGNAKEAVQYYKKLLFGDDTTDNIFQRVQKLISDVKKGKYSELGEDGIIENEMLNYLIPIVETKPGQIGRFLLYSSQTDNRDGDEKKLYSAFSQLFNYTNTDAEKQNTVRDIAKDLAIYAYYSTFDQNVGNSFFHLVPASYRAQYDIAIKKAMSRFSKQYKLTKQQTKRNNALWDENEIANLVIDSISVNYWYINGIVPIYRNAAGKHAYSTLTNEYIGTDVYGKTVEGISSFILSSTTKSNYIKTTTTVSGEKQTILYKWVGEVIRTNNVSKKTERYNIYIPVQKAGLMKKGQKYFELYINNEVGSVFDENKLPAELSQDKIEEQLQNLIEEANARDTGTFSNFLYSFYLDIPTTRISSNLDVFRESIFSIPNELLSKFKIRNYGHMSNPMSAFTPIASILKRWGVNVVINITTKAADNNLDYSEKQLTSDKRVVNYYIDESDNLKTIDEINAVLANLDGRNITIAITSTANDSEIGTDVSQKVEDEISRRKAEIEKRDDLKPDKKQELLDKIEKNKKYIEQDLKIISVNQNIAQFIYNATINYMQGKSNVKLLGEVHDFNKGLSLNVLRALDELVYNGYKNNTLKIDGRESTPIIMRYKKGVGFVLKNKLVDSSEYEGTYNLDIDQQTDSTNNNAVVDDNLSLGSQDEVVDPVVSADVPETTQKPSSDLEEESKKNSTLSGILSGIDLDLDDGAIDDFDLGADDIENTGSEQHTKC